MDANNVVSIPYPSHAWSMAMYNANKADAWRATKVVDKNALKALEHYLKKN